MGPVRSDRFEFVTGTLQEIASKAMELSNYNYKVALACFLNDLVPKHIDRDALADQLAQVCLNSFDDLLGSEVRFSEVMDAAYSAAIMVAATAMQGYAERLGELGHVGSAIDMTKPEPKPENRPQSVLACEFASEKLWRLFISQHKFGAYPPVAVLLSNLANEASAQIDEVRKRDRELDHTAGVWEYQLRAVFLDDDAKEYVTREAA